MHWDNHLQPQAADHSIQVGPIALRVSKTNANEPTWQHILIQFGELTATPPGICLEQWPTRAIALARKALDELEQQLKGE